MRQRIRWSEFDIQQILDKLAAGVSVTRIAADFEVSRTAIYQLLDRRGIDLAQYRRRPKTEEAVLDKS